MKPPKIACKAMRTYGSIYLTNCVRTFGSRMSNNRGFCDFFAKKIHKNLQAQQAPSQKNCFGAAILHLSPLRKVRNM
jgi:hypothetical protein